MCWSFLPHVRFLILLTVFELLPKTCNFTICSIFSNSGHVGWCTASPDTILKLDTLVMIQTKFGFHWSSTFRGEDFWKSLRRTTDDDDGRQVMAIAHMTLWVRWAKNGFNCLPSSTTPVMEMLEDYIISMKSNQKMFVIHYYINKQILNSYLHTKSEKIWLLFTFVLNWVFLRFPWQRQAFWNVQASKPFIHMPYNISIKFHPIPSTFNFSRFLWQRRPFWNFSS